MFAHPNSGSFALAHYPFEEPTLIVWMKQLDNHEVHVYFKPYLKQ